MIFLSHESIYANKSQIYRTQNQKIKHKFSISKHSFTFWAIVQKSVFNVPETGVSIIFPDSTKIVTKDIEVC